MYAINPATRFTLITPDECTKKIPNGSLDSSKWQAAIELAEARFVEPLLGWTFYQDFCTQKNVIVDAGNQAALQSIFTVQFGTDPVTGNPNVVLQVGMIVNAIELATVSSVYSALWLQALYNYIFNCVWFVALSENYAQFTSSGIQKNNPLDSAIGSSNSQNVGISLEDLRYLTTRYLTERINPSQVYVEKYLCINLASYPLYPQRKCADKYSNIDNEIVPRTTTFVDIYDDNCDDRWWKNRGYNPVPPVPTPASAKATCSITLAIAAVPNNTLYLLCNMQSIPSQYAPSATTLTLANLVSKYVNSAGATYNGNPAEIVPLTHIDYLAGLAIGYDMATGTFYRDKMGGWNNGDVFSFLYVETS